MPSFELKSIKSTYGALRIITCSFEVHIQEDKNIIHIQMRGHPPEKLVGNFILLHENITQKLFNLKEYLPGISIIQDIQ